jgi:hypothetical protein
MATNSGSGTRKGAVKNRSQIFNPLTGHYLKRDTESGLIIDVKTDGKPYKGIIKEPVVIASGKAEDYDRAARIESAMMKTHNMMIEKKKAKVS